jgi:glycosyltransferase involved in cell wall biosynthesis
VIFFAHTDLADELPTYASQRWSTLLSIAGGELEKWIVRGAAATATISPLLRDRLLRYAPRVHHVSPPFAVASEAHDRQACRRALGIGAEQAVVLYAGNLDAYQGVKALPQVLVELKALGLDAMLLVATESDPQHLLTWVQQAGLADRMRVVGLSGEAQRARLHASADVVLVPRRSAGGLPIKLLDAMARGVPVVASPAAVAGYSLENACLIADESEPRALARGVATLLHQPQRRSLLIEAGHRYLRQTHSAAIYLADMEAITCEVIASSSSSRSRTRR